MGLGLKIPSSKPRILANGKRGLQNPYFDLKMVCKIRITMITSCFSRSEFCTLKRALKSGISYFSDCVMLWSLSVEEFRKDVSELYRQGVIVILCRKLKIET